MTVPKAARSPRPIRFMNSEKVRPRPSAAAAMPLTRPSNTCCGFVVSIWAMSESSTPLTSVVNSTPSSLPLSRAMRWASVASVFSRVRLTIRVMIGFRVSSNKACSAARSASFKDGSASMAFARAIFSSSDRSEASSARKLSRAVGGGGRSSGTTPSTGPPGPATSVPGSGSCDNSSRTKSSLKILTRS
jgi:hypothetical protein